MQSRTFRKVSSLVSLLITIDILTSLSNELLNFADFFFFCAIFGPFSEDMNPVSGSQVH